MLLPECLWSLFEGLLINSTSCRRPPETGVKKSRSERSRFENCIHIGPLPKIFFVCLFKLFSLVDLLAIVTMC